MGCDRISEFPDCLLTHILSYLSTKDSVKTSVLSKRWEFLWLNVSGLDLNDLDFLPYGFVYRFFEFNRGSCLQTFKLKYCRYTKLGYDSSNSLEWITQMVHRRVQHLDLENKYLCRLYIMPECVYVSKTLVSLKLVKIGLKDPKFDVSLPCLKIMHLANNYFKKPDRNGFCFMDYLCGDGHLIMKKLISGSPVLENITMEASICLPTGFSGYPLVNSFWTNVPQCLSSTLEYVTISVRIMDEETGIKLVNYFLENSAVLKKLTLSCKYYHKPKREAECYKKLLTSTKLSTRCQVLVS
ncbi:hypothetical protein BRARA_C03728 [Brassica rapa]|uniref:F-box domain-containing protein n=1 Tax=Brassica campestris TaxID=3711 RepID=A0A398A1W3_BRACM|nr:hypothetical protein BRARA_C03728 [Brassica rapa]CAG7882797.1 unnamed protein product [Brassica rapa]VDC82046.1 unnamed protein product [Brassica rapa]